MPRATHQSPKIKQRAHRPTPSPKNHPSSSPDSDDTDSSIYAKFARAKELETELNTLTAEQKAKRKPSSSSQEKSDALRLQLCQLLSDLVLTDPQIAHSEDAIGRIWKYCFYGRINEIRSRIAKEKSRSKKRQAGGLSGGGAAGMGSAASSQNSSEKNIVEELEKQLKVFLKEAIALYEYLIEKYIKLLLPMSQASSFAGGDPTQSQESQDDHGKHAIIATLYRMHIHLGDLHRYSNSIKQAEECYLKSTKLAPGTGNPYNQLAVVAQSQDSLTAVALYYYARSLMATYQPFETSRSNLVRLFETNHKWLEEHERNNDSHSRMLVTGNMDGNSAMAKKAQREWMHKEKSAMNRKFLAQMVDLQWAFFKGVSLDGSDGKVNLSDLLRKMSSLLESFTNLLSNSSFSESLLCKIVAILAFSSLSASSEGKLCSPKGLSANQDKDPKWNEGVVMTNQALAFSFFLRFCTVLANHIVTHFEKKESGEAGSKPNVSRLGAVRSLSPLLLGFNFVTSVYKGSDWFHGLIFYPDRDSCDNIPLEKNSVRDLCNKSEEEFWDSVATVLNHFDTMPNDSSQAKESIDFSDIKEFSEFYGFFPFHSFLSKRKSGTGDDSEYVSAEEVVDALSVGKLSTSSKLCNAETNRKIRFLLFAADNSTLVIGDTSEAKEVGRYFLAKEDAAGPRRYFNEKNRSEPDTANQKSPLDDDSAAKSHDMEGVVMLTTSYSKTGVPLLVPGNILGSGTNDRPTNDSDVVSNISFSALGGVSSTLAVDAPSLANDGNSWTKSTTTVSNMFGMAKTSTELATASNQQASARVSLPPPPGFSAQLQPELPQPSSFIQPNSSLTSFIDHNNYGGQVPSSELRGFNQLHESTLPQAAPVYTKNPFAQTPAAFDNDYNRGSAQKSGFDLNNIGWDQGVNRHHNVRAGLDPTLDFMLGNSGFQSPDEFASSDALGLLVPSSESDDQNNTSSLLKFLFEPNNLSSEQSSHDNQKHQYSSSSNMPFTRNPFAT